MRQNNYFSTLPEVRNWLEDTRYADRHNNVFAPSDMTVDTWFDYCLETGLRTGELIGLTWDAVDWKKRTLTINKILEHRHKQGCWRAGPPKTKQSYRTIPPALMKFWNSLRQPRLAGKSRRRFHRLWSTLTDALARKQVL